MSRSRRKPYMGICSNQHHGETYCKKLHHRMLRSKRKKFLYNTITYDQEDFGDMGDKKIEGLDSYLFNSDGGSFWRGYWKEIFPEEYKKLLRK